LCSTWLAFIFMFDPPLNRPGGLCDYSVPFVQVCIHTCCTCTKGTKGYLCTST